MTRLPQFPDNRPLTDSERQIAAAVGQVRQQHDKKLADTVGDINLRKWCVDMATKAIGADGCAPALMTANPQEEGRLVIQFALVAVAREIYEFVCADAIKDEAR